MKKRLGMPIVEAWLRIGVLIGVGLLAGLARAEETKGEIFDRWLGAIVIGAPESGLKAMAEFKRSEFGGVVDYVAELQGMSCRAAVEDGKVRGSQILAFKDQFPEETTRKKIEKLYGITFPEPRSIMGGRNYRVAKDGIEVTLGLGGMGGGTRFGAGRDPMAQPEAATEEDPERIDYLGIWLGKVVPSAEAKPAVDRGTPGTAPKGKVTMVLWLSLENKGYIIVFAPDRDIDPNGEKGLTKGHMFDGAWKFKDGVVTFTPNPKSFPAEEFPDLRPLELAVSKPAEDKVEVSLGDFVGAGLPLPKGDSKFTLHEATPKEKEVLFEKLESNVSLAQPRPTK